MVNCISLKISVYLGFCCLHIFTRVRKSTYMLGRLMFKDSVNLSPSVVSPLSYTKKFLERNYKNNLQSNYTEIIEELCKNFQYSKNSQHYWSQPELSLLYGTSLYEQCSRKQKVALNHLYWFLIYRGVADSETDATRYNLVTAGSLIKESNNYQTIADMLEHETKQEYTHIKTFYKVGFQVYNNIIRKHQRVNEIQKDDFQYNNSTKYSKALGHLLSKLTTEFNKKKELKAEYQDNVYVREFQKSKKNVNPNTNGFVNGLVNTSSESIREMFGINLGSKIFLGCSFYIVRYMANLLLKNFEHKISKYYSKLEKQNEFIPDPTSISHYHFLDEAFHTTTSLKIGQDLYKEFQRPSNYEKFFANVWVYKLQHSNLVGLSGIFPNYFIPDGHSLYIIYNLLRSSLFDMSTEEAIYWLEACLCNEHDGFHTNKKYHKKLLLNLCKFTENIDYLWPINREMKLVQLGGSIQKAIGDNTEAFKQFSNFVRNSEFV